jgi:uroporphyrinogen-III synthase
VTSGLRGAQILVTRPAAHAENLCRLIEQKHGIALRFPTLEICAVSIDPAAIERAARCDWLIFTSANAVDFALSAFGGKMASLRNVQLAAIGRATADALLKYGLHTVCLPTTDFSSEGLLAEPAMQTVSGLNIMIVRGVGGREKLAQTLSSRGAEVNYMEVYQRRRPENDNSELVRSLCEGRLGASTITSGEALQNLLSMLDDASRARLRALPIVVVSERIAELARELGFDRPKVARQATDAAILETLTTLFNGENSGRSN